MVGTMLLIGSIGGASWSLIFMIIGLILLFIAAFVADGVGTQPRISFGWAGIFFAFLGIAVM